MIRSFEPTREINKPGKIGEKNQGPKMRTEGLSLHPPRKLHLQMLGGKLLKVLRIIDSNDRPGFDILKNVKISI
jgi:hypothetical protein